MKLIIRFFFSVCLLLLGMHGHTFGNTYKDYADHTAIKNREWLEQARIEAMIDSHAFVIKPAVIRVAKATNKMEVTDSEDTDEDEDQVPVRKFSEFTTYQPATAAGNTPRYFSHYVNKCSPFYEHFSYLPSQRYILLQVIRI